jgi:hypothetical protein
MSGRPVQIVTCDERQATLFRGTSEPSGRLRLADAGMLLSRWLDFHERHRPAMLGYGPSANARQHFADEGHEREEASRRFAGEVAQWIRELAEHEPERRVIAFAAPRFLGNLRRALEDRRDPRDRHGEMHLFRSELSRLRASELAAHPAVRALVASTTPRLAQIEPAAPRERARFAASAPAGARREPGNE